MSMSGDLNAGADPERRVRFCDIVLEGGITSGIVYATAIADLSREYKFASIGGSSIGGFAAALAAAAEYARRQGRTDAFDALRKLPDVLADTATDAEARREARHSGATVRKSPAEGATRRALYALPARSKGKPTDSDAGSVDGVRATNDAPTTATAPPRQGRRTLKERVYDPEPRTKLERLFVPQPRTRRLFAVFLAALGGASWRRKTARVIVASWGAYFAPTAALVLFALGLGFLQGMLWTMPTALLAVVALFAAPLSGIAYDLTRNLVRNDFGMCRGWDESHPMQTDDLAWFMHDSVQRLAGLDAMHDAPLTFAQLHRARGGPAELLGEAGAQAKDKSIQLQIYATNVAHGRPYRFPRDASDDMDRLFFRVDEMERFFPRPVVAHLLHHSRPYAPANPSDPPADAWTQGFRELPSDELPIVVAARLAMSFPLLLSALPLHAIDYGARDPSRRRIKRCWFSDGGLCSNFPIHLFDSFVPQWPTFGISLETRNRYHSKKPAWLPDRHYEGRADVWHRGIDEDGALSIHPSSFSRLRSFLIGLWKAAWAWNDSTMMRMPGVRDRVVRIRLDPGQGGVNIRMTPTEIKTLAGYGEAAAAAFIRKFVGPSAPGWKEQRWVRFNVLLIALRQQIAGIGAAADSERCALPLDAQINRAKSERPLRGNPENDPRPITPRPSERPIEAQQAADLRRLLDALKTLEREFARCGPLPYDAVPRPALRVRHPT